MILEQTEFVECDSCRAKTGSPELCLGCLNNRALIEKLNNRATELEDLYHLNYINEEVQSHLRQKEAKISPLNVIQAMYELNHADWVDGSDVRPTCEYESDA